MQENEGTPEFFEDISTIILVLEVKSPTTGGKSYLLLKEVGVLGAATNKSAAYEFFWVFLSLATIKMIAWIQHLPHT